mmetsp:Transcript_34452/g.59608  ORF Transcript_34452/g.59608 Transcript_34452/m.59608 type:complete len:340 (-) Transcript_34452:410-1429(-)
MMKKEEESPSKIVVDDSRSDAPKTKPKVLSFQDDIRGLLATSFLSLSYYYATVYIVTSISSLVFLPFFPLTWIYVLPFFISVFSRPTASRKFLSSSFMKAFPKYFDFEEALEIGDEELVELMKKKNFIFAIQPHGVMPMVNFCQHIKFASKGYPMVPTAVATVIYKMPIVKNVMGLFGIVNASKSCFTKALSQQSVDVYVGGMAELFLSDANSQTERLYLSKRKGFIKVAMRVGADVIPVYSFGNTTTLRVFNWPILKTISRVIGISVTWTYGRFYLPIPMPTKCVYVRGRPLGLPRREEPTDKEVEEWHEKYLQEVARLFAKYQDKCPEYRGKTLVIE